MIFDVGYKVNRERWKKQAREDERVLLLSERREILLEGEKEDEL